jgi:hypothetical protein
MPRRLFPLALVVLLATCRPAIAAGFETVFNGKDLSGWTLVGGHGPGYVVRDGVLVCPAEGGGNLFLEKEYSDFVFRFEFQLTPGANNGVGLRAPLQGDAAYVGMEAQILDDGAPEYAQLLASQYHGSIYKVCAARRGALKPTGAWNREEIRAVGRRIQITLNGKRIVDCDLNAVQDPAILAEHPGMLRPRGHIGFLGHGSTVSFRNIAIQDLSKPEKDNRAPAGFTALFNGKDLTGWKGLVGNPVSRAQLSPAALLQQEAAATVEARKHWRVTDGQIVYDGKNDSLCTARDYGDVELWVDWKIEKGGDSGIYLRGNPQVQIWDTALTQVGAQVGSGGLYNNQKSRSTPLAVADHPPGQWNRFRILMVGDRVTIFLNDVLVVHDTPLENYWERGKPLPTTGQIELQHHGSVLYFKNIYVRPLASAAH